MFIRKSLVKDRVVYHRKNGRRKILKGITTQGLVEVVDKTYRQFREGKSVDRILEDSAIGKRHKRQYNELLLQKFLKEHEDKEIDCSAATNLRVLAKIAKIDKKIGLGFVYLLEINSRLKVGRTEDISKRLESYKSHAGTEPIVVRLAFVPNHKDFESSILQQMGHS